MFITNEHYRNFDLERLIFKGGGPEFNAFPTAAEGKEGKEKAETPEEKATKVEDKSPVIKDNREKALNQIRFLSYRGASAKKIADKWRDHATARFDQISKEYNAQREIIGTATFDTSEQARNIEQKAVKLFQEIKDRMEPGRRDRYIRHQSLQDRIDQAKENMKDPKKKEVAEKQLKAAKESIILDYLNANKDTKGMSQPMKEMLARFIVEGNLVQLEYADIDADLYKDNVDDYFRHVDNFRERIGKKLEGKLEQVVKMFLAEAPNPDATKGEIALFKKWILEDPTLKAKFGTSTKPDSMLMKAVNILAKKYDVRFSDGKMTHATIVTDDGGFLVQGPEEFEKSVKLELTGAEYSTPDKLDDYGEEIDDKTENLRDLRGEVDEGLVGVAKGGEINSWDDWKGHEAATALMTMSKKVRTQTEKLEAKARQKDAQERAEKAKEELKDGLSHELVEAGMKEHGDAMKKAGYEVKVTQPNFEGTGPTKMEYKWTKEGETVTVSVDYTKKDGAKFTVHMERPETEEDNGFDASLTYNNAADFKKLDLTTIVKEKEVIYDKNSEIVRKSYLKCGDLERAITDLKVPYKIPNEAAMLSPDFKMENPKLVYQGQEVGHLEFTGITDKDKEGFVTITIDGKQIGAPFRPKQLETKLKAQVPKMKEVAQRAAKNKEEITKKAKEDKGKIKEYEGLTANWENLDELKGDFKNPDAKIKLATFNKTDKTEAAALYIKVGSKPEERKYVLTADGKDQEFGTMEEVNTYIEKNRETLAKVPEKASEPPKLREGGEKARENLKKIVMKLWGEKMTAMHPNDPEFNTALDTFINKLTVQRLHQLTQADAVDKFVLTGIERTALHRAFREAYGFEKLDAVDEKEVKVLSDLEVKYGDKTQKFSEIFGENFIKVLSMNQEIKAGEKPGEIQIKDGEKFVTVDAKGLAKYVPAKLRPDYEKLLRGEKVEGFDKKAGDELKAREAMREIKQKMRSPKQAKEFGKMGIGELIANLGQLWKMFQEAMRTGDFKTLQDALEDFNKGRNPAERVDSARESYAKGIEKIDNTGELLELYNNPYGDKAKALFDTEGGTPYRIQLKQAIEEKMEKSLGVDITEMEKKSGGLTQIRASKGADTYMIYLEQSGTVTYASMKKVMLRKNGSEYLDDKGGVPKSEVKNLDTGDKSLAYVLFKETPKAPGSKPAAGEKPGEKPAEKAEKVDYQPIKPGKPMDKASKEEKDRASAKYKEARSLFEKKDYDTVIKLLTEAYAIVASPNIHFMLIRALSASGKTQESLIESKKFDEFIAAHPGAKKNYKKAIDGVKREVKEIKEIRDAFFSKGLEQDKKGNFEAALRFYRQAHEALATSETTYLMATCYDQLKKPEDAIKLYTEFLSQSMSDLPAQARTEYKAFVMARLAELKKTQK